MAETESAASSAYSVRAVERALHILECFDDNHAEMGISEIAHAVGLHKATAHRLITTLVRFGYLERNPDTQKYRLGLQLPRLGFQVVRRMDLRREALPKMTLVSERFDEICDLSVLDRGEALYVEVVQGKHALTIAASMGQRLPLHSTASGKVFLAAFPAAERDQLLRQPLKAFTAKTLTSRESLLRDLALVQKRGYSVDEEEMEIGVRAVAAAIRDRSGAVVAAIGVPGPTSRITREKLPKIAAAVRKAADAVSHELGWQG